MVFVYIWRPDGKNNKYGHVAMTTKKYHFSIWPTNSLDNFKRQAEGLGGTPGTLVFHDALDKHYENKKNPDAQYELANVTDAQVEKVYEELFLRVNGIDPESVTIAAAEKLIAKEKRPEIDLPKTEYSFLPEILFASPEPNFIQKIFGWELFNPFQHAQSCVSLAYNMIMLSDPEPSFPFMPPRTPEGLRDRTSSEFYVEHFEEITQNWFVKGARKERQRDCIIF